MTVAGQGVGGNTDGTQDPGSAHAFVDPHQLPLRHRIELLPGGVICHVLRDHIHVCHKGAVIQVVLLVDIQRSLVRRGKHHPVYIGSSQELLLGGVEDLGAPKAVLPAEAIPAGAVDRIEIANDLRDRLRLANLQLRPEPANALDKGLIWSSSDEAVATVDANGSVTGHQAGTVTITATAASVPGVSANCEVTVHAFDGKAMTGFLEDTGSGQPGFTGVYQVQEGDKVLFFLRGLVPDVADQGRIVQALILTLS